ncbi:hypothetical protein D3C76_1393990 [compost metagenome]
MPWAGVVIGMGRPPWTVTPREKPINLIAICPWSWYIVTTASKALASPWTLRKIVSPGYGPSAAIPNAWAERTAGPMMSSSSRPNEPLSPLCGFKPQTPMRGFSRPLRLSAVSIS